MSETASPRELGLREAIEAWKIERDQDALLDIINAICNEVVGAMRAGSQGERSLLAADLGALRKAKALPFPGTDGFLHILQLMLRDQLGATPRALRMRARLPDAYVGALMDIERLIAGEVIEEEPADATVEAPAAQELTPQPEPSGHAEPAEPSEPVEPAEPSEPVEHPDPAQVREQVLPIFEQGKMMLHDPQFGSRGLASQYVDSIATQATKDESAGSPWFDAAAALRALAALLRGESPKLDALTPEYRQLVEDARA